MRKIYKNIFRISIVLFFIFLITPATFLTYISITNYQPPKFYSLQADQNVSHKTVEDSCLSIISWNLGYNGLGKEMDFFYDGGKKVRASRNLSLNYLKENTEFIKNINTVDFWFFQEVDVYSKRSYFIDQTKKLNKILDGHNSVFAKNYSVNWIPIPLLNPLGKVKAGMMSFSKFTPIESSRIAYPNIASWPNNLFLLDRCFILSRFLLPNNRNLVLINTHNSYYVNNDSLRNIELQIIRNKLMEEYNDGNYVIAGGDWNRLPFGFCDSFQGNLKQLQPSVPETTNGFLPKDWKWVYDRSEYTNRELNMPFDEDLNKKASIDYFIISPNVEVIEKHVYPLNFENSDHNPVYLKFKIKNFNLQKTGQQ